MDYKPRNCNDCGVEQDRDNSYVSFFSESKGIFILSTQCKTCHKKQRNTRYASDEVYREYQKNNSREWMKKNPDYINEYYIENRERMLENMRRKRLKKKSNEGRK